MFIYIALKFKNICEISSYQMFYWTFLCNFYWMSSFKVARTFCALNVLASGPVKALNTSASHFLRVKRLIESLTDSDLPKDQPCPNSLWAVVFLLFFVVTLISKLGYSLSVGDSHNMVYPKHRFMLAKSQKHTEFQLSIDVLSQRCMDFFGIEFYKNKTLQPRAQIERSSRSRFDWNGFAILSKAMANISNLFTYW